MADRQHPTPTSAADEPNPFDGMDELPGLGIAVVWVVLSYVLVSLLLMPASPV